MGLYPLTVNTPPEDPAHIYAEDDAAIYEAIVGGDGVYDIGNKMEATVIDNNTVRVSNGVLSVGGHLARIKYGDYQDMVIDNGESGKNRNDLIVANFSTTGPRGVDTYTLKVIKGEAVSGEAADPAVAEGNLYEGATERDLPLYRVRLEGISIVAVDVLYSMKNTMENMQKELAGLNSKLSVTITASNGLAYERYGDGKMRVYGRVTTAGSTSAAVIDLAIPFRDAYYTVQVTPEYLNSYPVFNASAQITTASRFNIYTRKVDGSLLGGVKVYVLLEGRWK